MIAFVSSRPRRAPSSSCFAALLAAALAARLASCLVEDPADDFMFHHANDGNGGNVNGTAGEGATAAPGPGAPADGTYGGGSSNSTGEAAGAASTAAKPVDALGVVENVLIILAIAVVASLVLLLLTYLQLRYCKDCSCWPGGRRAAGAGGSAGAAAAAAGGSSGGRRSRARRAPDTGLAAEAGLQGMTRQERLDVINHLLRSRVTTVAGSGSSSKKGGDGRDVEAGEGTAGEEPSERQEESLAWEAGSRRPAGGADPQHHASTCSICLSGFRPGQRVLEAACGHRFHHPCCQEWLGRRDTCPYCRSDLYSPRELREAAVEALGRERVGRLGPKGGPDPDKSHGSAGTAASTDTGAAAPDSAAASSDGDEEEEEAGADADADADAEGPAAGGGAGRVPERQQEEGGDGAEPASSSPPSPGAPAAAEVRDEEAR